MIKALSLFIKISLIVVAAIWIMGQEGQIVFSWNEYRFLIDTSFFILLTLIAAALIILMDRVWRYLISFPQLFGRYRREINHQKGLKALTSGLSAVAAGDTKRAVDQAKKAKAHLPQDTSLALLLQAQAARLDGREDDARQSFAGLLEHEDTAFLGIRGLLQSALDAGKKQEALGFAKKAQEKYPKQKWIHETLYSLEKDLGKWEDAEKTLMRFPKLGIQSKAGIIPEQLFLLRKSAQSHQQNGQSEHALKTLKKAHKIAPHEALTASELISQYLEKNKRQSAINVFKKTWKHMPSDILAGQWHDLMPSSYQGKPAKIMGWYEKLISMDEEATPAYLAAANAAKEIGLDGQADRYISMAKA